ncbi:MAG: peptide/nickel transport system substrate-binding protein [bacterium]
MNRLSGALALIICAALVASGCGGRKVGATLGGDAPAKRGGDLTVLSISDVTSLDPGAWYYGYDYQALQHPTQRALYGWKPADVRPSPDLAAGMPRTSADGRTVTIQIKPNIRYSPPLQSRTVTSADVKYAIERTFLKSVANQYSAVYYGAIVGARAFRSGGAQEISGIQTPDDGTLVLTLEQPVGVISDGQALSLPGTVPVPQDYARRYDAATPSTYGEHQVFTGPYMVKNDGQGTITGYAAGRRLQLVRNPSWDPKTDYRPAYLDTMTFLGGNDIDAASRRILSGTSLASGDFAAPPVNLLRSALATRRDQLAIVPSRGVRFVALNTTVKPFDDVDVRRAVAAAIDRDALRRTLGDPALGAIATHVLTPQLPAFAAAGGVAGTFDFMKSPGGDLRLAQRYMRRAGYPAGRYHGPPLAMVGDDQQPSSATAAAVRSQLERLGFSFRYRQSSRAKMFDLCGVASARVAVCPNGSWAADFFDPQPLLDPVFDGETAAPFASVNWAQVHDPELDAGFDIAAALTDPQKRTRAYAEIDRTVTGRAYVVPWLWDNQISFASANVKGVVNRFDASWDMAFMSLR